MTQPKLAPQTHKSHKPLGPLAHGLTSLIRAYQLYISPLFGPHCRYYPSCSEYARQALIVHGPVKGSRLAVSRLLRCNPFNYGGVDPVPEPHHCSGFDGATCSSLLNEHKPGS